MGAHYSQCFASKQTIAPGDRCYALAIHQQRTYAPVKMTHKGESYSLNGISHCVVWPDAYWTPVGNFIEGIYLTCGDIEVANNPANVRRLFAFISLMLENAPVIEQGENRMHDLPYDLPTFIAENCPALQATLAAIPEAKYPGPVVACLTDDDCSALYAELAAAFRHTDDVAFKHRVFYADYSGKILPLQFTLLHGLAYDQLLASTTTTAADLFAKALEATCEMRTRPGFAERLVLKDDPVVPEALADMLKAHREMAREALARNFWAPSTCVGAFDSVRYFEIEQGLEECISDHAVGTLGDAELFARVKRVFEDRIVVACLESYNIRFAPKVLLYEDDDNDLGKHYLRFVRSVSKAVSAERKLLAAAAR
jgi:hypothetical protein